MKIERTKEDRSKILKRNQENLKLSSEYGWTYKFLVKQYSGEEFDVIKEFTAYS